VRMKMLHVDLEVRRKFLASNESSFGVWCG
jgi:hypothetical protein